MSYTESRFFHFLWGFLPFRVVDCRCKSKYRGGDTFINYISTKLKNCMSHILVTCKTKKVSLIIILKDGFTLLKLNLGFE